MKTSNAVLAMFVLAALTAVAAEARHFYINDVIKVTLRAGPSYEHRILAVLESGDRVELLEKGEDWSLVCVADGSEGWLATRLLTEKEPNILKIRRLEAQLAERPAGDAPGLEKEALEAEILRLESALAEARSESEAMRRAAANGPPDLDEARSRIRALEISLDRCRTQSGDRTARAASIRWFLAGAGVLLVGLLIGFKFRRRRSGLL